MKPNRAQFARPGEAVELGLTRVGSQESPDRPIHGFEELSDRLDLASSSRQWRECLIAERAVRSKCWSLRRSATAKGAGRVSRITPSLPGASSRRLERPSLQTSTGIGLSPSATTLRSSLLLSATPL